MCPRWVFLALIACVIILSWSLACDDDNDATGDDDVVFGDTWTAPQTGLMWQVDPVVGEVLNWGEAVAYCAELNLAGHADWRLPEVFELRTLIRGCAATEADGACGVTASCAELSCRNDACFRPCENEEGPNNRCYGPVELAQECSGSWSATPIADNPLYSWRVGFVGADVDDLSRDSRDGARCVR